MFAPLRSEVADRFAAIESYFASTKSLKGDLGATAKGLVFVQLYAAYEYTVRSAVQIAVESINTHRHRIQDMSPSLLALYLDSELKSLQNCGERNIWSARLKVFDRAFSGDVITLAGTAPTPHDGSHFRHTQLQMIFSVFGISRLPVRRRVHLYRIDEIVDHRNKIAHGNETASEIGRTYTRQEIAKRIRMLNSVCLLLISIFDGFCADVSRHRRH